MREAFERAIIESPDDVAYADWRESEFRERQERDADWE